MTQTVEFFFDFVSPYSYLAHSQLQTLPAKISYRPMQVLEVMKEVGNVPTTVISAAKGRYAGADLGRWVQRYGVPFGRIDMRTLNSAACMRAVLAAPDEEVAARTTRALYAASWGRGHTIQTTEEIISILGEARIDTGGLADRIDDPAIAAKLAANNAEAARRGVFGAPTFLIGEAMFFGNDRMDFVREHLTQGAAA
jgi:2-hydroxychromene-2-carboxylate isomerase